MRVYLAGAVAIEGPVLLTQRALGTPQAVVLFARLAAEPHTLVSRDALAEAIWAGDAPESLETALSALASRLRAALRPVGIDLATIHGAHQMLLPHGAWIDLVAADGAADEAEGLLRANRDREAWAVANVAVAIGCRSFLPDHRSAWVEHRRSRLRATLRRGLHILSEVSARAGDATLAAEYGETLVSLEPFREAGYRQLMTAHAAAGNRAEALRVYARLRELLRDELGTSPSAATEAVYLSILQA